MHCYPFRVNLHRVNGSSNALDDSSGRGCAANKTKDVNINALKNKWIKNIDKKYIMQM